MYINICNFIYRHFFTLFLLFFIISSYHYLGYYSHYYAIVLESDFFLYLFHSSSVLSLLCMSMCFSWYVCLSLYDFIYLNMYV